MSSDSDTPRGPRVLSKGRMEGFSDGVFGFAMTLLVADLALHPPGTALQQVLHAWPAYLAYLTSFETRVLSHRTTRRAADLCPLRRLPRGQCRYANEHDGELIKVDS